MNLNSIWSVLEESYGVYEEKGGEVIGQLVNEGKIPAGWGMWYPVIILFPSESVSAAHYMKIFPYGRLQVIDGRFATAMQHGFLTSDSNGYRATEKGKDVTFQGLQAMTDDIARLQPLSSDDIQRLVNYLMRLSESSFAAPEPPSKFCLEHYRNFKSTFSNDAPLSRLFIHYFKELDFFRMDSHMAAWQVHNIEGNRWEVFSEIWLGKFNTLDKLYDELEFRGITREEYSQILQELVKCGWIEDNAGEYHLTAEGKRIREEAEELTNRYFFAAWNCLSESELEDLMNLAIHFRDGLRSLKE
jgi:DNA-binding MarR family transcriptional regulator